MSDQAQVQERVIPAEADGEFRKAKVALMTRPNTAFFTTMFLNMKHTWDYSVPQAMNNGLEVKYNPDYFLSLDKEQRLGLMMEETLHTAFMHMERLGERDKDRWQRAADEVARNALNDAGFKLPPDRTFDTQYQGKSSDEVYRLIPVNDPPPPQDQNDLAPPPVGGGGSGDGDSGEGGDSNQQSQGNSQAAADANLRSKVEDLLVQANQAAKMAGNVAGSVPGQLELFLEKLLNPVLPWQTILRRWMMAQAKTDFTMRRPNKRFFPQHYLPSMLSESLVDVMVAVDISGSVSDSDFQQFVSETHRIMKAFKPKSIRFIQFDTKIQHDDNIRSLNDLKKLKFHGRGGTDPTPVIELANQVKPKVLLFFTDGEFWRELPDYKGNLVWLIHNNERFEAPYGKTVHYVLP